MIVKPIGKYVLRQIEGHPTIYVTMPNKSVRRVLNTVLTDAVAQSIIYSLGGKINEYDKVERVGH
jgi:hypothetical protein